MGDTRAVMGDPFIFPDPFISSLYSPFIFPARPLYIPRLYIPPEEVKGSGVFFVDSNGGEMVAFRLCHDDCEFPAEDMPTTC